ncbi:hypothetical protein CFOL_v3_17904 [Cephalotus follicularis]|uniref:Reverse transcriptase/retrotransposon-derived protein RNase H-like domain-containing protein n=1 Tax=Cephalotus follicularis TaxID=3775 RepID=A0A1Q3C2D7_CEPFO|nr:hypothetical protein CFOL_v3_17904 [Cephalotus follicularis]
MDTHNQLIKQIKNHAKEIPCLHLAFSSVFKIVETYVSDIGYNDILKQIINNQEQLVKYTSGSWNHAQLNYLTIKKEILVIMLCIQNFQSDILNQNFLLEYIVLPPILF